MSFTLYELTSKYKELLDYVDANDHETDKAFEDTLEMLEDSIENKAHNISGFVKSLEAELEGLKQEKKRLDNRIHARKNKIKRLKEYLQEQLDLADMQKVKTDLFTVWIQNNKESVIIEDINKVPFDYLVEQEPLADKKALSEAIKEGKEIEGVRTLKTKGIRIR